MNKDTTSAEEKVSELAGFLKNWAITDPETTLILGNVRRMLYEAHTAGASAMLQRVRRGIPKETQQLDDATWGLNKMRADILSHLDTLQKEIEGNK